MLSDALLAEGVPVQFTLLSDVNATYFSDAAEVPIFRDPSAGLLAWGEMQPHAVKHDTFVFSAAGIRTLFWNARTNDLASWSSDIRQAVEAIKAVESLGR